MSDNPYIAKCLRQAESKINRGKAESWTNKEFEKLSEDILQASGISISVITLKRLWGKIETKGSYTPQQATKDALAVYLGYGDWQEYISSSVRLVPTRKKLSTSFGIKLLLLLIVCVIAFIFISRFFRSNTKNVQNNFSFYGENLVGEAPHTATFHYDITAINDSVTVDFDDRQVLGLPKNKHVIRHGYLIPYYFNIRVIKEGKIIKNSFVHVLSENWEARIGYEKFEPTIIVVPPKDTGFLYVKPNDVIKAGLDKTKGYYWIDYRLFKKFGLSADSMTARINVINNEETGGQYCNDVAIQLVCEEGVINAEFYKEGCEGGPNVRFSEVKATGEFDDLEDFTTDLSRWRTIMISTQANKGTVLLDKKIIYSTTYRKKLGCLKGIMVNTMGSGAIDSIQILNNAKEKIYIENF